MSFEIIQFMPELTDLQAMKEEIEFIVKWLETTLGFSSNTSGTSPDPTKKPGAKE